MSPFFITNIHLVYRNIKIIIILQNLEAFIVFVTEGTQKHYCKQTIASTQTVASYLKQRCLLWFCYGSREIFHTNPNLTFLKTFLFLIRFLKFCIFEIHMNIQNNMGSDSFQAHFE